MSDSEQDLVQRAAAGEAAAFEDLFRTHFQAVFNYSVLLAGDPAEAEDLTQDAFIRAHANLDRLGPPWHFRAWVFRLTRNRFLDKVRREKPKSDLEEEMVDDGVTTPEAAALRLEEARRIRWALAGLPQTQREALVLRELHDLSYADIAELTGLSLANVRVTLHRARAAFQEAYGLNLLLEEPTSECAVMSGLLGTARDGELGGEQLQALRKHLRACSACRERRDRLALVGSLLGLPGPYAASDALADRILKSVQKASMGPTTQPGGARSAQAKGVRGGGEAVSATMRRAFFGGMAAISLGAVGYVLVSYVRYRAAGPESLLPTALDQVSIGSPLSGDTFTAGEIVVVDATAIGPQAHISMELWVNGALAEVKAGPEGGQTPLSRSFHWRPTEPGMYALLAQAFDSEGNVARSLPVIVQAVDDPRFPLEVSEAGPGNGSTGGGSPPAPPSADDSIGPAGPWDGSAGDWVQSLTADEPPTAPELVLSALRCAAQLSIHDLSSNEEGFAVYRSLPAVPAWQRITTLASQSQAEWITYTDQGVTGGAHYYVSSFNSRGETAGNFAVVNVSPSDCLPENAAVPVTGMEMIRFHLTSPTEMVYCYRSLNGVDWARWPTTGYFPIGKDGALQGENQLQLWPLDGDGQPVLQPFDLMLECWGRQGGELTLLGEFTVPGVGSDEPGLHVLDGDGVSLQLATHKDLSLHPIEFFPMAGNDVSLQAGGASDLSIDFMYQPDMVRPLLWSTTDPDACMSHLVPDSRNLLGKLLFCFPYPGWDAGEEGLNPQTYLVWDFYNDCLLGNGTPDPCKPFEEWVALSQKLGGSMGFRLYDSYHGFWSMTVPEHHVFVIPPSSYPCRPGDERVFWLQMWVVPGGYKVAADPGGDLQIGPIGEGIELQAGNSDGFTFTDVALYGPPSNEVHIACQDPLPEHTFVDVTFQSLEMIGVDDGDTGNTEDVEVYGYFAVDVPHSRFGSTHYLKMGTWDEQDGDCPDDEDPDGSWHANAIRSEWGGELAGGCPVPIEDESLPLSQVHLCESTSSTECFVGNILGYYHTNPSYQLANTILRNEVDQGDTLTLHFEIWDWDDGSANDLLCFGSLDVGPGSLAEWATAGQPFEILGLGTQGTTCKVRGGVTGGMTNELDYVTPRDW